MKDNPLKQLGTLGQSLWLDYIRRDLIVGGKLRRLIVEDGLRGMTSNPSIFEKAIAGSYDYDEDIRVKVPATAAGLPAIQQLIHEGISVNVTLLFGLPRYRQVAEAYIAGIESRIAQEKPVKHIASVASFFVSRIDALVDPLLEKLITQGDKDAILAHKVHGQVAIASAKMAYQIYKEIFGSNRFRNLAAQGARVQRLLWASTSTKNPDYSDVKYIESLIGSDTIDTIPMETLDAYRDCGEPQATLEQDVTVAGWVLEQLPALGLNIDHLTQQLEDEGVDKFNHPFDKLIETLTQKLPGHLEGES